MAYWLTGVSRTAGRHTFFLHPWKGLSGSGAVLIEFAVRARAAPVDARRFLAAIGTGAGVEYLADILKSGLFVAQGHREDTAVHLVLEKSQDFSRILTFSGAELGSVSGLHESDLLDAIAHALKSAGTLSKDASVIDDRGVGVAATSFEHWVKASAENRQVFMLHPDGQDIREVELPIDPVFVMTDHTPMPKNTYSSMARQGVSKLSVGPIMLHAAQCISIIQNEMDRRYDSR
jgi:tRNA (pseudouridine54-N1)-methyltransferase